MTDKIAVIGSSDSVLIFKSVGCDVFGVSNEHNTRNALNKAITEYKVIMITDNFAPYVEDIIQDSKLSSYPAILVIPSGTEKSDYALNKINEDVEKSLGVNILKNKEN